MLPRIDWTSLFGVGCKPSYDKSMVEVRWLIYLKAALDSFSLEGTAHVA
jgi:hypothetical protein